jgi:hypothetical protein
MVKSLLMRYFRRYIIFLLSLFLFTYISIGLIFYLAYSKPIQIPYIGGIAEIFYKSGFSKLYNFNTNFFFNDKTTFLLNFSNNDLRHKDSIFKLINDGKIFIIEDRFKNWRNFGIVKNGKEINAKFKLHGSSPTPYLNGYESFTIKSDLPINGYKKFKLITGFEFNYFNIFLNSLGNKFDLIAEDSGDIVTTNSRGKILDFFQYQLFNESYLESKYKLINPVIIRRRTFDNNQLNWHSSLLDDVSYNIDLESISKKEFNNWKRFISKPSSSQYDPEYIGSFLALIQFLGDPHQITGNNDKWVMSENILYPVYRNEGSFQIISDLELQENLVFNKHYYSSSFETYKKLLSDSIVLNNRNKYFKKIVDSSGQIINDLDSVFTKYKEIHKKYNNDYLKIKLNHNFIRNTLLKNIKTIDNFLDSGFTIISYDGENLKIKSSRKNKLRITIQDKVMDYYPYSYTLDTKNKSNGLKINEIIIKDVNSIENLNIKDLILNKNLVIEKDYSILYIN